MVNLLGAAQIRALAEKLDLKPTQTLGQNFVIDANICRKIVKLAQVSESDIALEIGPGLGSLTLALLEQVKQVVAVEIDNRLANQLPITVTENGFSNEKLIEVTKIQVDGCLNINGVKCDWLLIINEPYIEI